MLKKKEIEPKILYQPLKSVWYDMIDSGVKNQEYREDNVFWRKRLFDCPFRERKDCNTCKENCYRRGKGKLKYTHVQFSKGYPKKDDDSRRITFKLNKIGFGIGIQDWGADAGKEYLIEFLGERTNNDGTRIQP